MIKISNTHLYLALIVAIVAAVSSSLYQPGLYHRVSEIMMTNAGLEAEMYAGAVGEDPTTIVSRR